MSKVDKIERYENYGIAYVDGKAYTTFCILGANANINEAETSDLQNNIVVVGDHFNLNGFTVASHGIDNNLPYEVKYHVKKNSALPEILKKQTRIMYGQGLGLYMVDDDADASKRQWVNKNYSEVFEWLDSWDKDPDLEPVAVYAKQSIMEYYYMEGIYSQWLYNKSRRVNGKYSLPVRGLKSLSGVKCRLAKNGTIDPHRLIKDEDCNTVLFTDWRMRNMLDVDIFPRFERANPFKHATAVNYVKDRGFDEDIYSEPSYYAGLKDWIIGINLSPKYINDYLKNSLSAKLHVKIPNAWIEKNEKTLKDLCNANHEKENAGDKLVKEYAGISLTDANNKALKFSYDLLEQLINKKISDVTNVLSGAGENQGKAFWSRTFLTEYGVEEWKFEEIPVKYSEYIKSLLEYDTAALKRILTGKGLDPAISNISNEGVFNSGSQVYYSYLVYLDTQGFAEDFILEDLNRALWINFPDCQKKRVKFGFKRFSPPKQQETDPTDRMDANVKPVKNNQSSVNQ